MGGSPKIADNLNLYRNFSSVVVVGIIDIAFSLASNILFPCSVPKAEFATYRIFLLYSGYGGIFHIGLLDGLYLRAVGHADSEVPAGLVSRVWLILWVLQCLASFAILPLLLLHGVPDTSIGLPLVLVATVVATNLVTFYTYLLQATNHFRLVARLVATPRVVCAVAAIALILFEAATAMRLALCVLGPVVASGFLLRSASRSIAWGSNVNGLPADVAVVPMWRDGVALFLGNMGFSVALTVGALVASLVLERRAFAEYAFAGGLASLMLVGFEWLGVAAAPFYAGLVRTGSASTEWERMLLTMMWLSPSVYWGATLVVHAYLPSYDSSLGLLAWFSGGLPFLGIVRTRAAVVCRATGRQGAFLRLGVACSVVVGAAVVAGWMYGHSATWIAAGWTLAFALLGSGGWLVVARVYRLPTARVEIVLVASAVAAAGAFVVAQQVPGHAGKALAYCAIAAVGLPLGCLGLVWK